MHVINNFENCISFKKMRELEVTFPLTLSKVLPLPRYVVPNY